MRFGVQSCKFCGARVSKNALARAAHERGKACLPRKVREALYALAYRFIGPHVLDCGCPRCDKALAAAMVKVHDWRLPNVS